MIRSPRRIPALFAIAALLTTTLALPAIGWGECSKKCRKLKAARVIGVTAENAYLQLSRDMLVVKNKRSATQMGYAPYQGCASDAAHAQATRRTRCAPAVLSTRDAVYFCPAQVRPLRSVARAEAKGFAAYTGCGTLTPLPSETPTPTPTAATTPVPRSATITPEASSRISDLDSAGVIALSGGGYRAYIAPSTSSFESDTIYYSDSADGLAFGAPIAISGIAPTSGLQTFAHPAVLQLPDGSFMMLYEAIRHISSAGVDLHSLMRAVSPAGTSFTNSPTTIAIPNGSSISSPFYVDLVRVDANTIRIYYSRFSTIYTATSPDNGVSWSDEEAVTLNGTSAGYAPYPHNTAVVRHSSGAFSMFFVSSPTDEITDTPSLWLYSAESADGVVFTAHDTPLREPPAGTTYSNPSAQLLGDGSVRVYYLEQTRVGDASTRELKSMLYSP